MSAFFHSIQSLHKQLIIHRDIKPQRILLYYDKTGGSSQMIKHSLCAPGIVKNIGHLCECDIWSSGIVLYLMVIKHQRRPFETGEINKK